ncbi:uncharacterized protein RCC_03117 [Ramularia collo-cygni]|uniref:Cytochrome b561 domain-containing protein n=1 Tax=Ramularia collo-cygni TaxID=112498 RepID=A0A2D3VA26_9PEZI|nr:uncharacterized protein RCC_03117 [Ramularia collo-cygni]CZT17283.1 uncharacterized protein RCC_03117 [Ramularia collo-cygni]
MKGTHSAILLLALATSTYAQFSYGGFSSNAGSSSDFTSGSGSSSSSNTNYNNNANNNNDNNFDTFQGSNDYDFGAFGSLSRYRTMLLAHAVLATIAFGFFFPLGGILIRLGSFPGLWKVHALIQVFATMMYIAALVLGIKLSIASGRGLTSHYHPIIGYVLMGLLVLQPLSGMIHHKVFQKQHRRVMWSYGHIWLGRILITLGIVNGGLGLMFAMDYPILPPPRAAIIGYSVGAGVMWFIYLFAIMIGEGRREGRVESSAANRDEHPSSRSRNGGGNRSKGPRKSRSHVRVQSIRYIGSEEILQRR